MTRRLVQAVLMALCLAAYAVPSSAQVFTGRIDVTAKDSTGAILPGVAVEVNGPQTARAVTDTQGEAHFLNLAPGRYTVTATLSGFRDYKNDNVPVGAGSVIPLTLTMAVGGVAEAVNVQAETPVIEAKRTAVSTNVSLDELQSIPSSRDPWVVLQTVPGVVVDRVNVGGAESGQQSNYTAKGAETRQNTWNLDGIAITDMAAVGSSPTYYDFDMFQEMQVSTGGADPANATSGVQLNMVLRSGTNNWRGSTRYYFENKGLQSDNVPSGLVGDIASYNRIKNYFDTGVEGGGPIVKDRLFAWAAYGRTEPKLQIFRFLDSDTGYVQTAKDETILKNSSAKFTGEINDDMRASFTFFRGDKNKFGRSASATRPAETTWDQKGPTSVYKLEYNWTLTPSTFATVRYAHQSGGFSLTPEGGFGTSAYRDSSRVWHGTYAFYETDRPGDNVAVEANSFHGSHELKAGFGWRKQSVTSSSGWPGGQWTRTGTGGYPNLTAVVVRNWAAAGDGVYWHGYAGDTYTRDRLTVNLGLRWDRAASSIGTATVEANPVSDLLPGLTAPAVKNAVVFNTVTPRLAVAYALGENRKTLLRASYSMFAAQLDSNFGATVSSAIPYYSYAYYSAVDLNGDGRAQSNEFTGLIGTAGFDPDNPLGGNPDKIGSYKSPLTHEVLFGADHEVMPNFGISSTFTWRQYTNFNWLHYRGVTGSDYTLTDTYSGSYPATGSFSVPLYTLNEGAFPEDSGRLFEHRPGYTQRYLGFEIAATKRMSNHWMMRAGWSTGTHREYFDSIDAHADPTPTVPVTGIFSLAGPNKDGGVVIVPTAGSGKSGIYLAAPKYQFILTGAYEAPYGINAGVNYLLRQGYAAPYYDSGQFEGTSILLVSDVEKSRLPAVHSVDMRVSKAFTFSRFNASVDMDVFNLFNASTTLGREYDLAADNGNSIIEIMNPRIVRFGVRFSFK